MDNQTIWLHHHHNKAQQSLKLIMIIMTEPHANFVLKTLVKLSERKWDVSPLLGVYAFSELVFSGLFHVVQMDVKTHNLFALNVNKLKTLSQQLVVE
jgi:hypothetical protein